MIGLIECQASASAKCTNSAPLSLVALVVWKYEMEVFPWTRPMQVTGWALMLLYFCG